MARNKLELRRLGIVALLISSAIVPGLQPASASPMPLAVRPKASWRLEPKLTDKKVGEHQRHCLQSRTGANLCFGKRRTEKRTLSTLRHTG
jgi:hypothetical protein